jgi:hypothetical protein
MSENWAVDLSRDAKKQYLKLKRSGDNRKPPLMDLIDALVYDLRQNGPAMKTWSNYSMIEKGSGSFHHCHLRKGKPTYVACWRSDERVKLIEVFYVGTHEGAQY